MSCQEKPAQQWQDSLFARKREGQCKLVAKADQSISITGKWKQNTVRVRCCKWDRTKLVSLYFRILSVQVCTNSHEGDDNTQVYFTSQQQGPGISLLHSLMKQVIRRTIDLQVWSRLQNDHDCQDLEVTSCRWLDTAKVLHWTWQ